MKRFMVWAIALVFLFCTSGIAAAQAAPAAPQPVSNPLSGVRSPVLETPGARLRISPLARKLAAEKGIDFSGLQGTGPGGIVIGRHRHDRTQ